MYMTCDYEEGDMGKPDDYISLHRHPPTYKKYKTVLIEVLDEDADFFRG